MDLIAAVDVAISVVTGVASAFFSWSLMILLDWVLKRDRALEVPPSIKSLVVLFGVIYIILAYFTPGRAEDMIAGMIMVGAICLWRIWRPRPIKV